MKPLAAVMAALALSACASLTPGATRPTEGYLSSGGIGRLVADTPTPSPDFADEATAFTRVQPGTDRWWLAISHAELRPPYAAQHFDCALGTRLSSAPHPALDRVMGRLAADAGSISTELAARHARPRPVAALPDIQPCQRTTAALRQSPSWPASAAVVGAAWGELMAELAPDRADAAHRIGQELGQSRVVCRMNWPSDVLDGQHIGQRLYAEVAADPAFRADFEAARLELTAARSANLTSPACAAERLALRPDAR